ncbi:MAG TPA: tetratricopeptide repeat protein [Bacteroidia bacterium]|nr:tetratricopeptide repeat protein [Bacteroidia bacterium]
MGTAIKIQERDRLFAEARKKREAGDYAAAAEAFSQVTERYPDHAPAWVALGELLQIQFSDAVTAENCFKKAIETDPGIASAYIAYTSLLIDKQRFAEANAMINKALGVAGRDLDQALYQSALFRESQGRLEEAAETYKKAIMASFSDETITACEKGIHRCEVKRRYRE